jgi:hypothetical protein
MDDEVIRQVGSFVIGASMAVAQTLVGTKRSWSWLCVMAVQVLYIIYGLLIDAWGFAIFAVFFIVFVNTPNYVKWRREEKRVRQAPDLDSFTRSGDIDRST